MLIENMDLLNRIRRIKLEQGEASCFKVYELHFLLK